jgi:Glycosyltransferase family 87
VTVSRLARLATLALGTTCSVIALLIATTGFWYGDAHAYWNTDLATIYQGWFLGATSYAYSPVFVDAMAVLHALPWPVFSALWTALLLTVLTWLVRRSPPGWRLPLFTLGLPDALIGNVHILMAAAIVVGFRYAGAWAFILLTKVTPGIGLVWFAIRREWRPLTVAVGVTAALALGSYLVTPYLWPRWIETLWANRDAPAIFFPNLPVLPRLPVALAIAVWAARTDRRWGVVLAAFVALPNTWFQSLALLVGIGPLVSRSSAVATTASTGLGRTATTGDARPSDPVVRGAPTT